jgi:hypothetical protein
MGSERAWYWLAAGVLMLGINSEYQSGKLQWAHRYVIHSIAVANDYARCGRHYLAQFALTENRAGMTAPQNRVEVADLTSQEAQNLMVREQVQYALARAEMARRELERHRPEIESALRELGCQHPEIEMARQTALEASGHALVVCPRARRVRENDPEVRIPQVRVEVPQVRVEIPRVRVDVPQVHVAATVDDDDML